MILHSAPPKRNNYSFLAIDDIYIYMVIINDLKSKTTIEKGFVADDIG